MNAYCIAGLTVESDMALPGAPPEEPAAAPDVVIGAGPVPDSLPDAMAHGPTWEMTRDSLLMRLPGIAAFLLRAGRDIRYQAAASADHNDVAAFLSGPVFGALLHQRGQIVLRASAVRVRGNAVLFCGISGAGKSTLAAALMQAGYAVVADDVCVLDRTGPAGPHAHGDGAQLKLWRQAIGRLGLTGQRGPPVRNDLQKFHVASGSMPVGPLPLGAIYVLHRDRPPRRTGIVRPNAVDATLLLEAEAYQPLLVRRMDQRAGYFRAAAAIANRAGIYELTRPFSFEAMGDVVGLLKRHWDELALTGAAA